MYTVRKISNDENLKVAELPFFAGFKEYRSYIAAIENDLVIGIVCYNENSSRLDVPDLMGMGYLSVTEHSRNKGIARKLLIAFYEEAVKNQTKNIYITRYEPDGELYLKHVVREVAKQFPTINTIEHGI